MPGALLTTPQLAEKLNVSRDAVIRWVNTRRIPVVRLGEKTWRYDWDAVLAALTVAAEPAKP